MSKDNGGPAFPCVISGAGIELNAHQVSNHEYQQYGISLRDYFAAKAILGWRDSAGTTYEQDAKAAYAMADAMLAERAKASQAEP